ncbi:MAG: hypothetical protein LQ338_003072 [Usnochroma carphineum]|nr:MAG: hypothetical protein LQ338_003072 [Usnochroma carphineum]
MAKTRGSSGITAPRTPFVPTSAPASRQTTKTKTKKPSATKANTSKPRAKKATTTTTAAGGAGKDKTATGRVTKAPAAAAAKKKKTTTPAKKAPATTGATGATEKKKKKGGSKTENKRDPTLLDKVQGVAEKIVGVLEGKPGKKAAGTRKIRGTDGKGATRAKKV